MNKLVNKTPKILVTGATGYIGAHVCKVLYEHGYEVVGLDINDQQNDISKWVNKFIHADVRNITYTEKYDAIIHLAGLISVEESTKSPSLYYDINLNGTLKTIYKTNADAHFIFASTAGAFDPQSPYAKSKVAAEDVIRELVKEYTIFRFFNVAGSDGYNTQQGESTHLIRIAAEVATGTRPYMNIYGNDYDTPDGTCVRDYIHVVDLATAIANAVREGGKNTSYECIGSGNGYSVREVIETMEKVSNTTITKFLADRRSGDPASLAIDNQYDGLTLSFNLEDMCRSAWQAELRKNNVL